jgi:hypothetical protein
MSQCAELPAAPARRFPIAAWAKSILARLPAPGSRRLDTVEPTRWSRYMLRDIGLSE